ncbi:MAG: hypothetical protein ABIK99_03725 [candidate division WOR-3 bacterium]
MAKVYGIIFAHADLPQAYKKVLESIFGKVSDFAFLSNAGLSAAEMKRRLRSKLSRIKNEKVIIFVDVEGGSCSQVCLALKEDFKDIVVIAGLNLPILFKFLQYRDRVDFSTLLSRLLTAGKNGIKIIDWKRLSTSGI